MYIVYAYIVRNTPKHTKIWRKKRKKSIFLSSLFYLPLCLRILPKSSKVYLLIAKMHSVLSVPYNHLFSYHCMVWFPLRYHEFPCWNSENGSRSDCLFSPKVSTHSLGINSQKWPQNSGCPRKINQKASRDGHVYCPAVGHRTMLWTFPPWFQWKKDNQEGNCLLPESPCV